MYDFNNSLLCLNLVEKFNQFNQKIYEKGRGLNNSHRVSYRKLLMICQIYFSNLWKLVVTSKLIDGGRTGMNLPWCIVENRTETVTGVRTR